MFIEYNSFNTTQAFKRRFFILKGKSLYYTRSEDDMEQISMIDLRMVTDINEAKSSKVWAWIVL